MSENGSQDTIVTDAVEEHRIPTRADARRARRQEEIGFWFPLHDTGGEAHVRIPDITKRAELDLMPDTIQREVHKAMQVESGQGNRPRNVTLGEFKQNLSKNQKLADLLCVYGFVLPKLVLREEDIDEDEPYCMLVTDLSERERKRFLLRCIGNEEEAAKRLQPFLVEPAQPVPARAPEPVAAEAVRHIAVGPDEL
ncbi:MAG: hypothetical protein K0S99_813 [Thermomicrobiales bacterium]|jgi:hypothetical protein|nr:hypothetical protein [Thermomicrobiales bacterium]